MSIVYCSSAVVIEGGYTFLRRTWRLFGIPLFSTVQVIE